MYFLVYMQLLVLRLIKDDSGALTAEHAFLVTFVAIVSALGMVALGSGMIDMFTAVGDHVPDPSAVPACQMDPFSACPDP